MSTLYNKNISWKLTKYLITVVPNRALCIQNEPVKMVINTYMSVNALGMQKKCERKSYYYRAL